MTASHPRPHRRRRIRGDADVHTLIGADALDALDDTEHAAVERHLARCASCAAEAAELRATAARLADTLARQPPPHLREQVLAAAARTAQHSPARRPGTNPGAVLRRRPARWLAATAAAAVLIAGAGGYAAQHRLDQAHRQATDTQRRANAEQAQRRELQALLAAPDVRLLTRTTADGSRIRLITSRQRDEAAVFLSDLAAAPARHTYQLWLLTGSHATSVGILPVGQHAYQTIMHGVRGSDAFGLSIEPAGGSPTPTHIYTVLPL